MAGRDRLTVAARPAAVARETLEARLRRQRGYRIAQSIPEGMTQRQVADAIGTTQAAVSDWANGVRRMSVDQVAALADHLNVDRAWLAWGQK